MTTIRVKENEPFDVALRRFKRTIEKLGLLTELRAREFYEKPTAERKRKKAAAVKRHARTFRFGRIWGHEQPAGHSHAGPSLSAPHCPNSTESPRRTLPRAFLSPRRTGPRRPMISARPRNAFRERSKEPS